MGDDFRQFDKMPGVHFECSMLQTAVEGPDGIVAWRDVQCGVQEGDKYVGGDPDDFEALWSQQWRVSDFCEKDDAAYLPCSKSEKWTCPAHMAESWKKGAADCNQVVLGRLHRVDVGRAAADGARNGNSQGNGVLGVTSRPLTRAYVKKLDHGGAGTEQGGGVGRKRKRGGNQHDAQDLLVMRVSKPLGPGLGPVGDWVYSRGSVEDGAMKVVDDVAASAPHHGRLFTSRLLEDKRNKPKILERWYRPVPVKKIPVRVAKYDVHLRESSLRAVQAMHAILSHMVKFTCNHCKERFPTFHPAYAPPPSIAKDMEILRHGKDGVAACNVEVSHWDELPPLDAPDGVALCCSGTCLRCQRDMDEQAKDQGGDGARGQIVAKRSEENHMDPCFRFPWDDLKDLFESATLVEAMLIALEHMQVNFVTISSGLTKFRRNTLSFPQDIVGFAQR